MPKKPFPPMSKPCEICGELIHRGQWEKTYRWNQLRVCRSQSGRPSDCAKKLQSQNMAGIHLGKVYKKRGLAKSTVSDEFFIKKWEPKPRPRLLSDAEQAKIDRMCREMDVEKMGLNLAPCRSLSMDEIAKLMDDGKITPVNEITYNRHPWKTTPDFREHNLD